MLSLLQMGKAQLKPEDKGLFRSIASRLAQGQSVEQIARDSNYKAYFIEQVLVRADFQEFFQQENPAAFSAWKTARDQDEADEVVKHLARQNAVKNYRALQAMADDESTLKPEARATVLEKLLKMSGTVSEEATIEVVKISPAHLAALRDGAREMDEMAKKTLGTRTSR
jgi:hypothetical protein